ncbi:MAG: serine protein kinase RIO, partial [Nanoarchaeota archaeon]|nr:serine protein kinase RIO [Nanoarchaeota archaeon]
SEFNILNFNDNPIFIDLSHATPVKSPGVSELIDRDVKNICRFFNKHGLKLDYKKELKEIIS